MKLSWEHYTPFLLSNVDMDMNTKENTLLKHNGNSRLVCQAILDSALERFGSKKTLAVAVSCIFCFIFLQFFAPSIQILFVGEFLAGLVAGCFVVIAPTYASEIAPLPLRALMTSYINLSSVIGQFIGQGIMTGLDSRTDEWAYRIPFAIQWVWPVLVLSLIYFAPESPYWLVRKGKYEEAEKVMK